MFFPDAETCDKAGIAKRSERFKNGESFQHYLHLQKLGHVDENAFPVPVGEFNPNEIDRVLELPEGVQKELAKSNPILVNSVLGTKEKNLQPAVVFYKQN